MKVYEYRWLLVRGDSNVKEEREDGTAKQFVVSHYWATKDEAHALWRGEDGDTWKVVSSVKGTRRVRK